MENNYDKIKQELRDTKRDGIDDLIWWLDSTDFKTAPASTKFHLNVEGGLAQHSLNVLKFARHINTITGANLIDSNIVISALLHDLCKVNYYIMGEEWDKEHKDKTNQWRKKQVYRVDDKLPLGHGEKSVIMAHRYIGLSDEEMMAIRWHMGFSDGGTQFSYPSGSPFRDSLNRCPLVKVIMMADQMAEMYETLGEEREKGQ